MDMKSRSYKTEPAKMNPHNGEVKQMYSLK